ncbi:MAG TPA: RNase adapter RapZ [Jatrophihabitans sp.]|nr:RNase adapter RapZ [Jatrophihabitans sp.]
MTQPRGDERPAGEPAGRGAVPAQRPAPEGSGGLETVIITGLSGAGRSAAAKCFEDLGFFVVDNLPPELIGTLVDLGSRSRGAITRLAVVMDVRSRAFSKDLRAVIRDLADLRMRPRVLFLEAADDVLVRRFENVRRTHPLQGDGRLVDGIEAERELLAGLRDEADLVIDTSDRSVHDLRRAIESAFPGPDGTTTPHLRATVLSFGYKYGLPVDADLVVDVRFLPNPHWIPELRPLTGLDDEVRDYVLSQEGAEEFLDRYTEILRIIGAGYRRESKPFLTLAVGCTGGKHRSVAMSEQLAARLTGMGVQTTVVHRDLGRE